MRQSIKACLIQVCLFDPFIIDEYFAGKCIGNLMSTRKNNGTLCIFKHQMHVMGDHDNRLPLLIQLAQKAHDFTVVMVVLSCRRFIQNDDLRFKDKNGCNGYTLFLSIAEGGYRPVNKRSKATDGKCLFNTWSYFFFTQSLIA